MTLREVREKGRENSKRTGEKNPSEDDEGVKEEHLVFPVDETKVELGIWDPKPAQSLNSGD